MKTLPQTPARRIEVVHPAKKAWGDRLHMELFRYDDCIVRVIKVNSRRLQTQLGIGRRHVIGPIGLDVVHGNPDFIEELSRQLDAVVCSVSLAPLGLVDGNTTESPAKAPTTKNSASPKGRSNPKDTQPENRRNHQKPYPDKGASWTGEMKWHGYAWFDKRSGKGRYKSYCMDINVEHLDGVTQRLKGNGLKDAIEKAGASVGDRIQVINHGYSKVCVPDGKDENDNPKTKVVRKHSYRVIVLSAKGGNHG